MTSVTRPVTVADLPATVRRRWPDEETGPFVVELELDLIDGIVETMCFRIMPVDPKHPVTVSGTTFRELPLRRLVNQLVPVETSPKPPGPPLADEDERILRALAAVYLAGARATGAPTVAVAEHFGFSRSTAGRWVARARQAGLLPYMSSGRPNKPPGASVG